MKKKYQNLFFLFGIAVFVVMLTQLDYREVWSGLRSAGYWFFAVLALWAFLYVFNTATWYIIIRSGSGGKTNINFFWLYKITVSGFALNYTTPCGLMGGEPYRIMALSPKIGAERASSSVILYAMTHIFSHFIFWLLSILIYVCTEPLDNFIVNVILLASLAFCVLGVWFFIKGYRKGMAVRLMNFMRHVPGVKKWARGFIERHKQQLDTIDCQIAALHNQNRNVRDNVHPARPDGGCKLRPVHHNSRLHQPVRQSPVLHPVAARRARGRFRDVNCRSRPFGRSGHLRGVDCPCARACVDGYRPVADKDGEEEQAAVTLRRHYSPAMCVAFVLC